MTVAKDNDKNPVISLREIAAGNIDIEHLRSAHVTNLQKNNKVDEIEDENLFAESQEPAALGSDYSSIADESDFSLENNDINTDSDLDFSDNFDGK